MSHKLANAVDQEGVNQPQVRVLFFVQSPDALSDAVSYLRAQGCQVGYAKTIEEAMEKILRAKPQAVFISWNLKNVDIKATYKIFLRKYWTSCILFAEDGQTSTEIEMISSGLKNYLTHPLTGPKIWARVKTVLKMLEKEEAEKRKLKLAEPPPPEESDDLPDQPGEWVEVEQDSDGEVFTEKTYKFVPKDGFLTQDRIYYFKGEMPPKFNMTQERWEKGSSGGLIFQERASQGRKLNLTQKGVRSESEDDNIKVFTGTNSSSRYEIDGEKFVKNSKSSVSRFEQDNGTVTVTGGQVKTQNSSVTGPVGVPEATSVLEQCLREAVRECTARIPADAQFNPLQTTSQYLAAVVHAGVYQGYIICSVPSHFKKVKTLFDQVYENFKNKMENAGLALKPVPSPLPFKFEEIDFLIWAKENGSFFEMAQYAECQICFAFFPTSRIYFVENMENEIVPFPIESIHADVELTFDVFLHLVKNNKIILYEKSGYRLLNERIQKLKKHKIRTLHVKRSDLPLFFAYQALCAMKKSKR